MEQQLQKKLTEAELLNLTEEKAWEIAGDFGDFLQESRPHMYSFESQLPWSKGDISVALLKLIRILHTDQATLEVLCTNLQILNFFIPSPEDYQRMLQLRVLSDELEPNKLDLLQDELKT